MPPPTVREATPREQLLDSIKRGRPLKPTLTRSRSKREYQFILFFKSNNFH